MSLGPFAAYVPPGVYSRTLTDANVAALVAGLRIPDVIGVGQEELEQDDYELIRGSSSFIDQQIVNEDVTESWVVDETNPNNPILGANNGTLTKFKVRNFPIVDGQGFGRVTNDVRSVSVTVNGTPVAVGSVRGSTGEIIVQVPPQPTDAVRVTYYFHRGDTSFTDDVSDQVSKDQATLTTPGFAPFSVVAGSSDTFKLKVNGGVEKTITFAPSPAITAQVNITGVDSDGDITYKAMVAGAAGNNIRVQHVVSGTNTPLSISVSGTDITVNSATDSGGLQTSTANQVAAAVIADPQASVLVLPTIPGTGASLIKPTSFTNLAGGQDGGSVTSLKTQIDAAQISGLTTSVFTSNDGTLHLNLVAQVSIEVTDGNANGVLGFANGTKTSRNTVFRVFQRPIVDGSSGGITTTDPSKVVVLVSGSQVIPTSVDGKNGLITLPTPPPPGAVVTIQYWANTWQDTFDYLPNTMVTNVIRVGISPGRSDYIQNQDFVVSNPSPDVSIIHWGTSYSVSATNTSPGAEPFDSSQIVPSLIDDRMYLAPCTRYVNTTVIPARVSTNEFLLPEVPTTGNGRDTPLGISVYNAVTNNRSAVDTNRPDLIVVRVGRTLQDALGRPAAKVTQVDAETRKITLRDPVPPDWNAYVTFWYNRISDDTYIFTCKTPGPVGSGQYEVFSTLLNQNLFQVKFGSKGGGLTDTVQWPRGVETIPDAFHFGGSPVAETVTVTFGQQSATNAVYTNKGAAPWSFYSPYSSTWSLVINGASQLNVNLVTANRAYLVGQNVALSGGGFNISSSNNDLEITVDGVDISVTLPTGGAVTANNIVSAINTAIDNDPAFVGTAPNRLAAFIPMAAGGAGFFVIRSYSTPGSLPGGFDHQAKVKVRQGTAETLLGFTPFQSADGTTGAINKPATILGSKAQPYTITSGVNDTLKIRLNGIDYTVVIQSTSTTASAVVSDINAVLPVTQGAASVGTLGNLNKVRITSALNNEQSSIVILDGTANDALGFTQGDFASQTKVTAQEVVDCLMGTTNFAVTSWTPPTANSLGAVAYVTTVNGSQYLTIESLVAGTNSAISFVGGVNSAFNLNAGTQITPGTDGDNGEAAYDIFSVSSSDTTNGSTGKGVPGQTYTDARTGLRFTVLPAADGSYTPGGTFTLSVSPTFTVSPSIPLYSVPGLELLVTNTVNVGVNDTASLQTFNPSGLEPKNGDFYFISYRFLKQDFSTRIFRQFKTIQQNYGNLSAENRVTLAAHLAIDNGAVLVGITQVLKVPNTNQASAQSFVDAISGLATPLRGNIKPDIIVPLSTDTAVYAALMQHCELMSNVRNQSERMGFIGFAAGTQPINAQTIARSLVSSRIVAFYPDSAVVTLTNELNQNFDTLVDGSFFAAAVAGAVVSPAVDVATPYTRRRIQGFTAIPRILDAVESNQTAVAGITLLEDLDPIIRIRQGLTTNMTSVLTRLPTVTQISDYTSQQARSVLDAFIGTKFLSSRVNEIEVSLTSLFKQLIQQEVVAAFTGIQATIDPNDPTILDAVAYYQPIFPLEYIVLTFNLRASI